MGQGPPVPVAMTVRDLIAALQEMERRLPDLARVRAGVAGCEWGHKVLGARVVQGTVLLDVDVPDDAGSWFEEDD